MTCIFEGPETDKVREFRHYLLKFFTDKPDAAFIATPSGARHVAYVLRSQFFPSGTWEQPGLVPQGQFAPVSPALLAELNGTTQTEMQI